MKKRWTPEERARFVAEYPKRGVAWCMESFGVSRACVRGRASREGLRIDLESEHFKEWQARAAATKVGRKRPDQSLVMKELHRSGKLAITPQQRVSMSKRAVAWHAANDHPRGMAGKSHSE